MEGLAVPAALYPGKVRQVPLEQDAEWESKMVCTLWGTYEK